MSEIKEKVESELKTVKSLCETMENAIKTQIDKGLDKVDTHELYEAVDIYKDLGEVKKNIVETCYKMQIMEAMEESEYGEDYDENGQIERRGYNAYRYANGRYAPKGRGMRRGYMYPAEYYRDMDRWDNKMYYSENAANSVNTGNATSTNGNMGYQEGYSEGNKRGYEDGDRNGYQRGYDEGNREGYQRGYSEGQRSNSGRSSQSNSRYDTARRNYEETKAMHNTNNPEDKQQKVRMLEKYVNELSSDITSIMADATNEEKTMIKSKLTTLANKIM